MHTKFKVVLLLLLTSVLSPIAAAAATPPDSGLLISQLTSQKWQVSLIAGTQSQQFSGTFEASAPIGSVTRVMLETADTTRLVTPNQLDISFAAWKGGVDRVEFTVASDAKLCLRDTGSSGVKIYLGSSLLDAVLVTAPVSLLGASACGSSTPTAPIASPRKYHPGHYIALMRSQSSQSVMTASIKPGVVGMLKRYTWRSLEPTLGVYDFSQVQSDLNWASAYGMQLVVMIEDKTFVLERPTPAYLDQYTLRNRAGGYTAVRWSPYVVTRMNALVKALGRFDSHPAFEGIATQETALGFDDATLSANAYTPEKYRDAYINILTAASTSLPTSRVFWYQNFFAKNQSYIGSIADAVKSKGVVMGGPDVLPDSGPLLTRSYPFFDQFQGQMPMFGQVEPVCYRALHKTSGYSTKYWTMRELFTFARDNLHVNYMFWVRLPQANPSDSYDWLDALPVISTYPTFNP